MAFITDTLARAAFKRTLGKAHTSNTKELANEAEPSFITIASRDVFADRIPSTPAAAISAGVSTTLVTLKLDLDPSSNGKAYFASITTVSGSPLQNKINPRTGVPFVNTDRVGSLIPPQYGTDFRAILKNNGTEVAPSSTHDWFIDYVSGIVTSEDDLSLVNGTLEAYVYIGRYLDSVIITHDLFTATADGYGVFVKGPGGTDGYSTVSNNVGIGTTTPTEKLTISKSTTGGLAINNSSTFDPVIRLQLANIDTFIAGIDNSDGDNFKLERGGVLGVNNDIIIKQTDGYIGIGETNPQQKMHVRGSLRLGFNTNETIISDLDLALGAETNLLLVADSNGNIGTPTGDIILGAGSSSSATNALFSGMFPSGVPRTEHMRIKGSSGNVGIGTTTPNNKLSVQNGNIGVTNGDIFVSDGYIGVDGYVTHQRDDQFVGRGHQAGISWNEANFTGLLNSKGSFRINIDSDNNNTDTRAFFIGKNQAVFNDLDVLMTILESGLVGIGTTDPQTRLHVQNFKVQNAHYQNQGMAIFEASEGQLQIISDWNGTAASLLALTSAVGATENRHWVIHHKGPSSSDRLDLSYITSTASGNILAATGGEKMTITTDGYIGIGTVTPTAKLNVYDGYDSATQTDFTQSLRGPGFLVTSDFVNGNFIPGLFWNTQNNNATRPKAGIYSKLTNSGSYMYFGTSNAFATGITNDAMVIKYDGNVGIGTTDPLYNLHVGNGSVTNSSQTKVVVANSTNSQRASFSTLAKDAGAVSIEGVYESSGPEQRIILGSITNHEVQLRTNNSVRMTVLGTGQIGIGTTTPTVALSLGSATNNTKLALYESGATLYGLGIQSSQFRFHVGANTNRFSFLDDPAGTTELFTIKGSGLVGIGSTNPGANLDISESVAGTAVSLYLQNQANSSVLEDIIGTLTYRGYSGLGHASRAAVRAVYEDAAGATQLRFMTSPASNSSIFTRMTVAANGAVGIGITNPTTTLTVAGNVLLNSASNLLRIGSSTASAYLSGSSTSIALDSSAGNIVEANSTRVYMNSEADMHFYTNGTANLIMTLDVSQQAVAIGVSAAQSDKLDVRGPQTGTDTVDDFIVQFINTDNQSVGHSVLHLGMSESPTEAADRFLLCTSNTTGAALGTVEFYIDGQGGTGISLTAQHWVVINSEGQWIPGVTIKPGMILSSDGTPWIFRDVETAIPIVKLCSENSDKKVFGVLSSDFNAAFDLGLWKHFNGIFNSMSKKQDMVNDPCNYSDNSNYFKARVNSGGEGKIWITNYNGNIQNGDYITTSEIPGYGMLQDDDILHSYTVAKCTQNIDWDNINTTIIFNGNEYKMCLISCTYHCG